MRSRLRIGLILSLVASVSCHSNTEVNNLALAQHCLDQVPVSNPTSASSCMSYIQDYSDQQANILKCSIAITSGGFTENTMVSAYDYIKANGSAATGTATFLSYLALTLPDATTGYNTAVTAQTYCNATGETGLIYISGLIVAGSLLNSALAGTGSGSISSLLTTCLGSSPPASCSTLLTSAAGESTLGTTAATLAESYCTGSNATQTGCTEVNSAVSAGAGNSAAIGQALLCYLNKQTYNPSTASCQ